MTTIIQPLPRWPWLLDITQSPGGAARRVHTIFFCQPGRVRVKPQLLAVVLDNDARGVFKNKPERSTFLEIPPRPPSVTRDGRKVLRTATAAGVRAALQPDGSGGRQDGNVRRWRVRRLHFVACCCKCGWARRLTELGSGRRAPRPRRSGPIHDARPAIPLVYLPRRRQPFPCAERQMSHRYLSALGMPSTPRVSQDRASPSILCGPTEPVGVRLPLQRHVGGRGNEFGGMGPSPSAASEPRRSHNPPASARDAVLSPHRHERRRPGNLRGRSGDAHQRQQRRTLRIQQPSQERRRRPNLPPINWRVQK